MGLGLSEVRAQYQQCRTVFSYKRCEWMEALLSVCRRVEDEMEGMKCAEAEPEASLTTVSLRHLALTTSSGG